MSNRYEKATKPTFYFIGVTTQKSSIMKLFPLWAKELGLGDVQIKGIDFKPHSAPEEYREAVEFLKNDELSLGALVTTHKLDLFEACKDMFDYIDPFAEKLKETSSLYKKDGKFCAAARDPITSGLAMSHFVPNGFWREHGGEVLLLGAGGSALSMACYLTQEKFKDDVPKVITIANRSIPRLDDAREKLNNLNDAVEIRYVHGPNIKDNDKLVGELPPYSLIVNATGLGKDAPGSPITDDVVLPHNSLVWEINYRGERPFMYQAMKQAEEKNIHVEDGWHYFIHGWTKVIEDVFHIEISDDMLERLSDIAGAK